MTLVEALKINKPLRRPIAKHLGSAGIGYLDPEFVFHLLVCGQIRENTIRPVMVNRDDILADDWEVKE